MIRRNNGTSGKSSVRYEHESVKPLIVMLLAAAIAALLIGMLIGFLLYPAYLKQKNLEREWAEKSSALQTELLQRDSGQFDPGELEALLRRVPTRSEREAFIRDLGEMGRRSGVEIIRLSAGSGADSTAAAVSSGPADSGGKYTEIRYELEIRGTWQQAEAFVREINAAERLIAIPKWQISGQSSDASWRSQPVSMSVVLVMYAGTGYEGKFSDAADHR